MKRARRTSSSDSAHSVRQTHSLRANRSRAEPVSNDDWAFRVSVISSATDIDNIIFTRAVQGLTKICFPEDILDELGIVRLEKHMRTENAPQANILKMKDIFQCEMVKRVIRILAEYLDSPAKIEAGVESIIAASAGLHGSKLGSDLLGQIVTNLNELRERIPSNNINLLADGATISSPVCGNTCDTSDSEHSSSEYSTSQNKARDCSAVQEVVFDEAAMAVKSQFAPSSRRVAINSVSALALRPNKICSSWSWDVTSEDIPTVDIRNHFTKTADLFAFHALPIAKKELGTLASRKEVRHRIESMFSDLQDTEHEKWIESYRRLLEGDRDMLLRSDAPSSTKRQKSNATTPVPIDMQSFVGEEAESTEIERKSASDRSDSIAACTTDKFPIKTEDHATTSVAAIRPLSLPQEDTFMTKMEASRHKSKEEYHTEQPLSWVGRASQAGSRDIDERASKDNPKDTDEQASKDNPRDIDERVSKSNSRGIDERADKAGSRDMNKRGGKDQELAMETPIFELLYGPGVFEVHKKVEIVQTLMKSLDRRVSVDSINVLSENGMVETETKTQLAYSLMNISENDGHAIHPVVLRVAYEARLSFWVAAESAAFSELHTLPVMFTLFYPEQYLVSNFFIDPARPFPTNPVQSEEMISYIVVSLDKRQLPVNQRGQGSGTYCQRQLRRVMLSWARRGTERSKRCSVEKILRVFAFHNRDNFPEIKDSMVVRTWERKTGQRW